MVTIIDGRDHMDVVRTLIREYTVSLGRDLSFQSLEEELADPAAKYAAPQGEVLLATENGETVGMVAYHRLSSTRCEMKRLYVRPAGRRTGTGEALARTILAHASAAGYREMVLDTIAPLRSAIRLYHRLGFTECEAYYSNPMDDVIYMKKAL